MTQKCDICIMTKNIVPFKYIFTVRWNDFCKFLYISWYVRMNNLFHSLKKWKILITIPGSKKSLLLLSCLLQNINDHMMTNHKLNQLPEWSTDGVGGYLNWFENELWRIPWFVEKQLDKKLNLFWPRSSSSNVTQLFLHTF